MHIQNSSDIPDNTPVTDQRSKHKHSTGNPATGKPVKLEPGPTYPSATRMLTGRQKLTRTKNRSFGPGPVTAARDVSSSFGIHVRADATGVVRYNTRRSHRD